MVVNDKGLNTTKFILASILSMISILFIGNLCKDCFSIRQYSAMAVFRCMALGMLIYILLSRVLNKWWYKVIVIFLGIVVGVIIYRHNKQFLYDFCNSHIFEPINYMIECYDYNNAMVFNKIMPLVKITVPVIYIIILFITEKFSMNFIVMINAIALVSVWALENWLLGKYMFKFISLSFIIVVINQFVKNCKKNIKKYNDTEITFGNLCWIVMPIAFVLVMACYLPSSESGILSENSIIGKINEQIYGNGNIVYGDQSILYKVGYNNSMDTLGGSISLDDKPVMYVYTDKPCYIRGNIKDVYNGYSWRVKNSYSEIAPNLLLKNLGPKTSITIKYAENFKTYNFFVPNNYVDIKPSESTEIRYSNKGEVVNSKFISEPYTVVKYDSIAAKDYLHADTIDDVILGQAEGYMDYQVSVLGRYNSDESIDDFRYDKYDAIITSQYKNYLQLPAMPIRVFELSDKITENCNSTYGKVQAIKKYLENNYTYSLKVDVPDRDKDFVDSFLFEEKKGYCTYFASAMAILCRAQGIPARYVEGFSMQNAEKRNNVYIVNGKCAHAWCEVLAAPEKNVWTIVDPKTSLNPDRPVISNISNNQGLSEQEKEAEKQRLKEQMEKKKQNGNKKIESSVSNEVVNKDKTFYEKYFKEFNLLTLTLCVLLIVGIIEAIVYSIRFIRYMKIMKDKSLTSLYKYYVKRLKAMDYVYEEGETDLEFMRKTRDTEIYPYGMKLVEKLNGELYGGMVGELDRKEYYKFINHFYKQNS